MAINRIPVTDLQRGDVIAYPDRETQTVGRFQVNGVASEPHQLEDGTPARAVFGIHHGPEDVLGSITYREGAEAHLLVGRDELEAGA